MSDRFQLILIFFAVMFGVVSAAYFYQSAGIFMELLKKPLKLIATGMFIIAIGVMIAAVISYESSLGYVLALYGVPLTAYFYILYIVGSIFILVGARNFTKRPSQKVVDVSMQQK